MSEFAVKCRRPNEARFRFVTPDGRRNSLIIHAARFSSEEAAQRTIELNTPATPEWEWKVVPL